MLIDMPPGTADVPLTVMQSIPLDGAILVTTPQELAGIIVSKAVRMVFALSVPIIGVVEDMAYFTCPSCGREAELFGKSHAEETAKRLGTSLIGRIPIDEQISLFSDFGKMEEYRNEKVERVMERVLETLYLKEGMKQPVEKVEVNSIYTTNVAIVMSGRKVAEHFGRALKVMLAELKNGDIKNREILETPPRECGTLPKMLAEKNVKFLIAGGIGRGRDVSS